MKSTEPESLSGNAIPGNVELPAVAIRENADPVGRTMSTSSLLSKNSTALRCLGFRYQSKLQITQ